MPWEKNFDVDTALEKAGEAFWEHGYEATSMRDLLEAMGIQKGSFYDTYGSKKEAYLAALQRYADVRFDMFRAMAADASPRRGLERMLDAIYEDCVRPEGHRGCMVMNCALELAHSDIDAQRIVQRAFETHEGLFAECIESAQAAGEISSDLDPASTAKALLALVMGMRTYSRSGAARKTLQILVEQAKSLLDH